jgi:ATP-binding cassette subfamily A (ABC1) protein 3
MKKRVLYFKRDLRGLMCEVLLPVLLVIAGLSILLIQIFYNSPAQVLVPADLNQPISIYYSVAAG